MIVPNEAVYRHFSGGAPTDKGRRQFCLHQSTGVFPEVPDAYFLCLTRGKRHFDWLCREYQQQFLSGEWWGFAQLREDWTEHRWLLPHLCKWYGALPARLSQEGD